MDDRRLHILGALCYVIGPAVLLLERENQMVRFHAAQASLLGVCALVVNLSLWIGTAAAYRQSWYLGVDVEKALSWVYSAEIVFWFVMLFCGYELAKIRIPSLGSVAERLIERH